MTIGINFNPDLEMFIMGAAEFAALARRLGVIDNNFQIAALTAQSQHPREFAVGNTHRVQNVADPCGEKDFGFFQRRYGDAVGARRQLQVDDLKTFGRFDMRPKFHPQLVHALYVFLQPRAIQYCARGVELVEMHEDILDGNGKTFFLY